MLTVTLSTTSDSRKKEDLALRLDRLQQPQPCDPAVHGHCDGRVKPVALAEPVFDAGMDFIQRGDYLSHRPARRADLCPSAGEIAHQ